MPLPIALSDEQMSAATPLERRARGAFLQEVAQLLQGSPSIGDGSLHRMLVVVQRRYFDPPNLGATGKYR